VQWLAVRAYCGDRDLESLHDNLFGNRREPVVLVGDLCIEAVVALMVRKQELGRWNEQSVTVMMGSLKWAKIFCDEYAEFFLVEFDIGLAGQLFTGVFDDVQLQMLADIVRSNRVVWSLDLTDAVLSGKSGMILAEALKENTFLHHLSLVGSRIQQEGMVALLAVLTQNRGLDTLDLSENEFGYRGAVALAKLIRENAILSNLKVTDADFGPVGTSIVFHALESNRALGFIDFSNCNINAPDLYVLGRSLQFSTNLRSVRLGLNSFGHPEASVLAFILKSKRVALESLLLDGNNFGDAGAFELADAISTNPRLQSLDLRGNSIGWDGFFHLSWGLSVNSNLRRLDLDDNFIDEEPDLPIL
jgi:Ran GTPase-activating protein (RanGAP) involved in mRNA processing and transport